VLKRGEFMVEEAVMAIGAFEGESLVIGEFEGESLVIDGAFTPFKIS
jgi:hypothetical protein